MSLTDINEFYNKVRKDQSAVAKILQGTTNLNEVSLNAIAEANNYGYHFTLEEARNWLKDHPEIKPASALSDLSLEMIAGGKQ